MSVIDILLLAASGLFAAWTFITLRLPRAAAPLALAPLAGLAVAQIVVEGPYWHLVPAYALVALCTAIGLARIGAGHWLRSAGARLAILVAAGLAALGWVFLPVPVLAPPAGPHAVATLALRWIDATRDEPMSEAPDDRRNVIAQAWYPALPSVNGSDAPYLDGLGRLPDTISLLPSWLMVHYDRIATAQLAAPVAGDRKRWPVVLFSPGYGGARGVYTSLVRDLASRGFIVIALDHPFESAVTELADGSIATPVERFLDNDPGRRRYMEGRLETRVADIRFVLDRLTRDDGLGPLSDRIDTGRIAVIGHSFGGATAVASMALDRRIKAAVDMDGALYGAAVDARLDGPALVIDSDHAVTGQDAAYFARTNAVLAAAGPGSKRIELAGTHHYSFTDALLLLSPPARWAAGQMLGVTPDAGATIASMVDQLAAFLAPALRIPSS